MQQSRTENGGKNPKTSKAAAAKEAQITEYTLSAIQGTNSEIKKPPGEKKASPDK